MSRTPVLTVIPARLGSTRFKRKVLASVDGRPLLYYVWRAAARSKLTSRVVIATDSDEIRRATEAFGAEVFITGKRHRTGSDRAAEIARKLDAAIVVNFQGDTLGLSGRTVDRAIELVRRGTTVDVATLAYRITDDAELVNPNVVKVVCDRDGRALLFSRSQVPFVRDTGRKGTAGWRDFQFLHHVGVYVFRRAALDRFARRAQSPLEKAESLEQLRLLEHSESIHVVKIRSKTVSIDSPEDLENWSRGRI